MINSKITCALFVSFCLSLRPCTGDNAIEDFSKQYKRQKNELSKVELIVSAIDAGLICPGAPVTNVTKLIGRKEQYVGKIVCFEHFLPDVGKGNHGWYLMYSVVDGVHLNDYGLTNSYATFALQPSRKSNCKPNANLNQLSNERDKVLSCVQAIQCGKIFSGLPLSDLASILPVQKSQIVPGEAFTKIFLEPKDKSSRGWYFAYSSEDGKTVKYYWISNVADGSNFVAAQLAPRPVSIKKPKKNDPKPLLNTAN